MNLIGDSFLVYTDGSCWTGDRIGGWAWVAIDEDDNFQTGGGSEEDTTISRMELMGAIGALENLLTYCGPSVVLVYSDSQYVVLGATDRSRARNKNNDLWERLDTIIDSHTLVELEHVRGHSGDDFNELADDLAGDYRKGRQNEKRV